MAFIVAAIGVLAIIALTMMIPSQFRSGYPTQNQQQPTSPNNATRPSETVGEKQQANQGTKIQEPQNYWEYFIRLIECQEKITNAISTIIIALFTIILGCATVFLYCATRNLVISTESTAERQLRAYVLYSEGELDSAKPGRISVKFKNSGTTPAYNVTVWADWKFSPAITDSLFEVLRYGETGKYSVDLGAAETHDVIELSDTGEEYFDVPNGLLSPGSSEFLYVWGIVKYRDIFQKCQYTAFWLRNSRVGKDGVWPLRVLLTSASNDDEVCSATGEQKILSPTPLPPRAHDTQF